MTCLKVTGNTAIIRIEGPFPAAPGWLGMMIRVVDNGGAGLDRFDYFPVDRGPFKPCRSPRTVTHGVQGVHRFKVRAIDRARNVDPSPATHRFTIGP